MKRLILIFVTIIIAPILRARDTSNEIVAEIVAAGSKMCSLSCDFVQEKTSKLMVETIKSTGRMKYEAPSTLVWEYITPMKMSFKIENAEIKLERDGVAVSLEPNRRKIYREIAGLISGCINGRMLADKNVFDTEAVFENDMWIVEMTPIRKDLTKMWSSLVLFYDPKTKNAVRFDLIEPSGDSTVIKFSNTKCN